jgi:mRNA-degrading endonuclease RelE of RelBE toxin-antitoxin system
MTMKPPIQIDLTARFRRDVKRLHKKYRRVQNDLQVFVDRLERGETPGERVQNVQYPVYKARIKNTDVQKGKSGGYRIVYYLQTAESIVLITIYSKSEAADIPDNEVRRIIDEYLPPGE